MISFKTYGDSNDKTLVLIHGLTTDGEIFNDFITEKFISKFNIVIPDIRGCGESGMLDGEFTIHEAATDIISVLNKFSKNKVVILGYSQGGTVAQEIAKLRPDIVNGLILVNTFSNNTRTIKEKIESYIMTLMIKLIPKRVLARLMANQLKNEGVTNSIDLKKFEIMFQKCSNKSVLTFISELRNFDSSKWLDKINCNVLIVRGEIDNAVPKHHAEELQRLLKNSRLKVISKSGHAMLWTHRQELVDAIEENETYIWT